MLQLLLDIKMFMAQSLSNPYTGILSICSTRILNGNNLDVYEDGLQSRDFVYIDDVVDGQNFRN